MAAGLGHNGDTVGLPRVVSTFVQTVGDFCSYASPFPPLHVSMKSASTLNKMRFITDSVYFKDAQHLAIRIFFP